MPDAAIVEADLHEWHCTCIARFRFAMLTDTGWVYIRVQGRSQQPRAYMFPVRGGVEERPLRAHCPACHAWKEALFDPETGWTFRDYTGARYDIGCTCSVVAG